LLAAQRRLLLVGQERGCDVRGGERRRGLLELPLVVVVVGLTVRGGQQLLDELRLVLAELIELRLGVGLLGLPDYHLGLGEVEVGLQLVDLRLLLDAVFTQEVDGGDAACRLQGGVDEVAVEDAHLGELRRGECRACDLRRAIELQLDFALGECGLLLDEREQRRQRRLPAAVPAVDDVELRERVQVARPREVAEHAVLQLGDARELHATSSAAVSASATDSSPERRRGRGSSRTRASIVDSASLRALALSRGTNCREKAVIVGSPGQRSFRFAMSPLETKGCAAPFLMTSMSACLSAMNIHSAMCSFFGRINE